ncbi:pyridoxamine 5'-phosphate oxidase family protein [Streptomyces sp. NPDC048417]|uniref:pyridoxamine 5'-phosphate oxidase family protein n=1 Tax=Streptomyces sp. NPDC048417 TaxID=3155387 RepID=UPI00342026B9
MASPAFDVDSFLSRPLTARIATNGPTVRPVWFLWEDGAFWVLTGPWARLFDHVSADPGVALVVDVCDIPTGLVRQVIARGDAELVPFDVPRGRRKLIRYLGADEGRWDSRFVHYLHDDPEQKGTMWLRLVPDSLTAQDLSYSVGDQASARIAAPGRVYSPTASGTSSE